MRIRFFALVFLGCLAACSNETVLPPKPVVDTSTERTITQGTLIGFTHHAHPAHVWRSIPFAKPPIDDLRWRAPRPAENWQGIRQALSHAPWCTQIRRRIDDESSADAIPLGEIMGQEDCLYLNVYAPKMDEKEAETTRLPVMMWIHGGSNVWGRAEQYDPSALVAKENVIVVVIQYRLGPLGWFSHETLERSAEIPDDRSSNFAILDQIAALDWIKTNIARFGGDPGNITVFGESAGGHNTAALLASPRAKGKFQKVIIQSGIFTSVTTQEARQTHPRSANKIAEKLIDGAATAENLRSATAEALFDAYGPKGLVTEWSPPRIIEDGIAVPVGGLMNALSTTETFNAVPVITGVNKDEAKLFNVLDPELVGIWLWRIPYAYDQDFYDALSEYESRMWRVSAVDKPANTLLAAGHEQVYAYRFDWDESGTVWGADFSKLFGAAHALEIPFVMGQFRFLGKADKWVFTEENEKERLELSAGMMAYWAEFARSGSPGNGGQANLPDWTSWSTQPDQQNIMVFDSKSSGGARMIKDHESAKRVADALFSDPRISSQEETCKVYKDALFWDAELAEYNDRNC